MHGRGMTRSLILTSLFLLPCAAHGQTVTLTPERISLEHHDSGQAGDLYLLAERSFDGGSYIEVQPRFRVADGFFIATAIEMPEFKPVRYLAGAGWSGAGLKANVYLRDDTGLSGHGYQVTVAGRRDAGPFVLSGFLDAATREGDRGAFAFGRLALTTRGDLAAGVEYQVSTERPDTISVILRVRL